MFLSKFGEKNPGSIKKWTIVLLKFEQIQKYKKIAHKFIWDEIPYSYTLVECWRQMCKDN